MPTDPRPMTVRYCDECPFARKVRGVGGVCVHVDGPDDGDNVFEGDERPPPWCPLRARPVLVSLKVRDGR